MNNYLHIKKLLYKACENFVAEQNKTINDIISSNKKALLSEIKSSAGDKHETGRAMLQLEMEKASQQLSVIVEMKAILNRITFENSSDIIRLGSLIITDKGNYYLAISAGKITIENNNYYAVSTSSPIGKQLLGKKVGAILPFNDAEILEVN
jgi:transcription elongation GreA/GreB family factor